MLHLEFFCTPPSKKKEVCDIDPSFSFSHKGRCPSSPILLGSCCSTVTTKATLVSPYMGRGWGTWHLAQHLQFLTVLVSKDLDTFCLAAPGHAAFGNASRSPDKWGRAAHNFKILRHLMQNSIHYALASKIISQQWPFFSIMGLKGLLWVITRRY